MKLAEYSEDQSRAQNQQSLVKGRKRPADNHYLDNPDAKRMSYPAFQDHVFMRHYPLHQTVLYPRYDDLSTQRQHIPLIQPNNLLNNSPTTITGFTQHMDHDVNEVYCKHNTSSIPVQSLQVTVSQSMEESMESAPFGIETSIDEELNMDTEDLFRDMMERQVDYVSTNDYVPSASYLPYRRYLVDWMRDIGKRCRLHTSTVHVSILFLDKIFRSNDIPKSKWRLLATACISVAAKYEEAEKNCPPIPYLLQLTSLKQRGHTSLSFREAEAEVLQFLGWRLRAIPPIHFIGYFLAKGTTFVDDTWQNRDLIEKIPSDIKKYADFFCNLTLQEYSFQKYLPSVLAAAILMASRVALQLQPRWRPELVRLTGYDEADIIDVFSHVWSYYEEQFPGHGNRSISPRSVNSYEGGVRIN